ncbi:MAG: cobalamin biosynthesis protein CobW [Magnetovibrio sp.]|nr:cobalamin biosynthesis protein CobW [Magnetovibrio sp.]
MNKQNLKIPTTIITGFLGAGKTTVIRHILENARSKRFALIINEFGDLGIDKDIITGCGIKNCNESNIMELTNGCICCTVADDFLPTMETIIDLPEPPEHIIIETSGLALPKPLVRAFNWPEIRSRVTVDGVVAVVDAPAVVSGQFAENPGAVQLQRETDDMLDHDSPLEEVFEDQILSADMVLLNKADLIDDDEVAAIREDISSTIGSAVKVLTASHGAIDPNVLLGIGAAVEYIIEDRRSHHDGEEEHDHDDFESFVLRFGVVEDLTDLEHRIKLALQDHEILRIKGFINVSKKDMRQVIQAVGPRLQRYYDRPWHANEQRQTELVIIGMTGLDRTAIVDLLTPSA